MSRPAEVPRCQMDLDLAVDVEEAEGWQVMCTILRDGAHAEPAVIQGGRAGLDSHIATVHDPDWRAR